MFFDLKPLLINMLFIIVPLFLFQIFWIEKGRLHNKYTKGLMTLMGLLTIYLCTKAPIAFSHTSTFDLRQIPLILLSLYGGFYVGLILYVSILIFHFWVGDIYLNIPAATLIILFLPFLRNKWENRRFKIRLATTTITSLLSASYNILYFSSHSSPSWTELFDSIDYLLVQGGCTWLTTYLIENSLHNIKIKEKVKLTDRLNVISALAASVSHEIRNPLTVTKGFLQFLLSPELSFEKRKEYVEISLKELERAEIIINDYLSMTKLSNQAIVISNLEEDITYIKNVLIPYAAIHDVEIVTQFDNTLQLSYERNSFRQSLINIGKNAIEAMPEGGQLKIKCSSNKEHILLSIQDTGIGMTQDQIKRLGLPYFTTKEKGTGIGMTVSYNAIHNMGGKIVVESELGKGTCFKVSFPGDSQKKDLLA